MRNDARTKLTAIRIDQMRNAGPQDSNAMGATTKLVGKYMYCDISIYWLRAEPDPGFPPSAKKTR
jgi:hypothetical protein